MQCMVSQLSLKRQALSISWTSRFHFAEGHALNHWTLCFQIWLAAYTLVHLRRRQHLSLPSSPGGLGGTPSSSTISNAQGESAAGRILPLCDEISRSDLCTGTWLNSSPLRASACRAGQRPGAASPPWSSWEATEDATAVTKRCNPPFCLGFAEAAIDEVCTKKYFTVCGEVGKTSPQSITSCLYWKQLPGTLTGLPDIFLICLHTSITPQHPQTHAAPTKSPLALTQLLPDSLTAWVWTFLYDTENAINSNVLCVLFKHCVKHGALGVPPQRYSPHPLTGNCY